MMNLSNILGTGLASPLVAGLGAVVLLSSTACFDSDAGPSEPAASKPTAVADAKAANTRAAASRASAPASLPVDAELVTLPAGGQASGFTRGEPLVIDGGMGVIAPNLLVTSGGQTIVAMVKFDGQRETITLYRGNGRPSPVSDGSLAWHPRLAEGRAGAVWLAWSGRDDRPQRGDLARQIHLRRVDGSPGAIVRLGLDGERSDAPDLVVDDDGFLHMVWESSDGRRSAVLYQQLGPDGTPMGEPEVLSEGWLARRPAVGVADGSVWVAWDSLMDHAPSADAELTPLEPDYDVLMKRKTGGAWSRLAAVDTRPGTQAAPRLAPAPGGGMLVAYHASMPGGVVKWWSLRRVRGSSVEQLVAPDGYTLGEHHGEQQGAEFPQITVRPDGSVALITRPSQGAHLHLIGADGISPPLDLTRLGWGARGRLAGIASLDDDTLLATRRSRKDVVLEQVDVNTDAWDGAPAFEPISDPAKTARTAAKRGASGGETVLWGDVHMHSAMSDGTGTPDEIYARCWVRGLDFAALTDHDTITGWRMLPSQHHELIDATRLFDARDDFVAFHAFEWTSPPLPRGFGHRNVYFHGLPPTPVLGFRHGTNTTAKLMAALRNEDAFVAPHHTTWTGTDWDAADPDIQRHVEMVSVHGVAEAPGGVIDSRDAVEDGFVVDGLKRGTAMGFVGGTDAHGLLWHHGLGVRRDPWGHALTCLVADGDGREDVWEALVERRSCATTGLPIAMVASVGKVHQGGEGSVRGSVKLDYRIEPTRSLVELVVVRDGVEVDSLDHAGSTVSGTWTDTSVSSGSHSYYLRAQQEPRDGTPDLAWSSPVFVRVGR